MGSSGSRGPSLTETFGPFGCRRILPFAQASIAKFVVDFCVLVRSC